MRLTILMSLLIASAAPATAPANAQALDRSATPPRPVIDCYCTDRVGARVELGETICLTVDDRAFLARCEMSLNNPMWRDTGADCVGAAMTAPGAGPALSENTMF